MKPWNTSSKHTAARECWRTVAPPPSSAICRRRGCSSVPPVQRGVPLDVGDHELCNGEDATAGDLAVGELSPVKHRHCSGSLTGGSRWPRAPSVSLSVALNFLFIFTDLNTKFKNSYLELEMSKLSEPIFLDSLWSVVFDKNMKCTVSDIFLGKKMDLDKCF